MTAAAHFGVTKQNADEEPATTAKCDGYPMPHKPRPSFGAAVGQLQLLYFLLQQC